MALTLAQKKQIVSEVTDLTTDAQSAVLAQYRGLTVAQLTDLRAKARKSGVALRVVRNNLARRAFAGTDFECLNDALVGPLLMAFSYKEPSAAARLIRDFAKENEKLSVTALALAGQLYKAKDLDKIAKLPTRNEAISQLMSVMQAPISKFVRTLAEPHAKFVRTLAAVREKKEASA